MRFEGNIAAQHTSGGATRAVGGNFGLTYDFGAARGAADVAIPDTGYNFREIPVRQSGAGFTGGQTFGAFGTSSVTLDGGFHSVGGTPAGGVAGNLDITNLSAGSTTSGVFNGVRAPDK